ncbi:hypothetical protein [Micromonospora deserti]|uniref:hypothetical protein n=1 Tax=Micromonospora deserti TaxID=2070366 RepID=UPI00131486CE|nr:hypothetical protein [Micromonospora deserti]
MKGTDWSDVRKRVAALAERWARLVWGQLQLEARTDQTFLPALRDGLLSIC